MDIQLEKKCFEYVLLRFHLKKGVNVNAAINCN